MKSNTTYILGVITGMIILVIAWVINSDGISKTSGEEIKDSIIVFVNNPPYELALVEDDLKTYDHLSSNVRQ
ncbi:hypothetical protein LCGC14_1221150 [marine sediment metagenome]|uniref:Uncharacterized protein n=1 Tax=marine sediment metagenome TaxID=412755 RepID=A0A0F9LYE7_9ZZZZ